MTRDKTARRQMKRYSEWLSSGKITALNSFLALRKNPKTGDYAIFELLGKNPKRPRLVRLVYQFEGYWNITDDELAKTKILFTSYLGGICLALEESAGL